MSNFDDMKLAVEAATGGKNTVILDDVGMPSVMVMIPQMKISELITDGSPTIHPGFIVGGTAKNCIYVSKYQNIVMNGRGYSLPLKDPAVNLNFDTALGYCRSKGEGWCMTPYALWSAIALWCRKNGTMPRGNNNYGSDISYPHEKGVEAAKDSGKTGRILTGSGPDTWNHNWHGDGICDLNGNVWEWNAGMRLMNGEIQIIPDSDIFNPEVSNAVDSTAWKAITPDGSFVEPGTSGTLKYEWASNKIQLTTGTVSTAEAWRDGVYQEMTLASGLTVPELAKILLLYPDEPGGDYGGDHHYFNPSGERVPYCGGRWAHGAQAGVFAVNLHVLRSNVGANIGFRSAYVNL